MLARHLAALAAALVQLDPQRILLRGDILHVHADGGGDASEGIDHESDQGAVAQAQEGIGLDRADQPPCLVRGEDRRLADGAGESDRGRRMPS
jgi:hypothetical protein